MDEPLDLIFLPYPTTTVAPLMRIDVSDPSGVLAGVNLPPAKS